MWAAVRKCGLLGAVTGSLLEYNLAYGPWQSAAWMRLLEDGAADASVLIEPNCKLLVTLWPHICMDLGEDFEGMSGRDARAAYLSKLVLARPFATKGKKASLSRWFSWQHAHDEHDKWRHSKLLVGLYVAIKKGWIVSHTDVWNIYGIHVRPGSIQPINEDSVYVIAGPGVVTASTASSSASVAASSSSSSGGGGSSSSSASPGVGSSATGVVKDTIADTTVSDKKKAAKPSGYSEFVNTFHKVLQSLPKSDNMFGVRLVAGLTRGEAKANGSMASQMRSASETQASPWCAWRVTALWSWVHVPWHGNDNDNDHANSMTMTMP